VVGILYFEVIFSFEKTILSWHKFLLQLRYGKTKMIQYGMRRWGAAGGVEGLAQAPC
jgi:hypothetical protein